MIGIRVYFLLDHQLIFFPFKPNLATEFQFDLCNFQPNHTDFDHNIWWLENNCRYSHLNNLSNVIHEYDIIITSTSSSLPLIGKGNIESALDKRNNQSIALIDLGVPRDIESQIKNLDNVYLYTMISPSYTTAIAQALQLPSISGKEGNLFLFEFLLFIQRKQNYQR